MAFSIPDAAVANVLLRRTRERNRKRLSPSSFAYHPDKNVFDAVLNLKQFNHDGKLFSVQIDFQKYFDLIPSAYIKGKLDDRETLSLTPHEKFIYEKFLHHRHAPSTSYPAGVKRRRMGTPQGSSASLFLANIANHDLDMMLASEAGRFVRFADDVVALCSTYEQAQRLERCFQRHCDVSGLKLNEAKSQGIAVVSKRIQEILTIEGFDYLGYRFSHSGLTTTAKFERNLKLRVSRLLNIYLLDYLQYGQNPDRCSANGGLDWDLLGLIYELRRVIYGGLSEAEIQNFLQGVGKFLRVKGLMGFYCLIEDASKLRDLDGWIVSMVRRAMRTRNRILQASY